MRIDVMNDKTKQRLSRLLEIANKDTGSSSRVAQFLLSLWNGNRYRADIQDLLYIDKEIFDDMIFVLNDLYRSGNQLDTFMNESDIKPVIDFWGDCYRHNPV